MKSLAELSEDQADELGIDVALISLLVTGDGIEKLTEKQRETLIDKGYELPT